MPGARRRPHVPGLACGRLARRGVRPVRAIGGVTAADGPTTGLGNARLCPPSHRPTAWPPQASTTHPVSTSTLTPSMEPCARRSRRGWMAFSHGLVLPRSLLSLSLPLASPGNPFDGQRGQTLIASPTAASVRTARSDALFGWPDPPTHTHGCTRGHGIHVGPRGLQLTRCDALSSLLVSPVPSMPPSS